MSRHLDSGLPYLLLTNPCGLLGNTGKGWSIWSIQSSTYGLTSRFLGQRAGVTWPKRRELNVFKEFKEFAMRGNVVDMAVGIVIGVAFGTIVKSFVDDVLMPPIGLLPF